MGLPPCSVAPNDPTGLTVAKLFGAGGDQVECASCHDVHDDTNEPFLIESNAGSAICVDCHNKSGIHTIRSEQGGDIGPALFL